MRFTRVLLVAVTALCCTSAFGWNCSVPGQIRVQVPAGTVGNGTGDGNGQVVTVQGLTFQCQDPTKGATPSPTNSSTNTSSSSSSSASNSTSTASGGTATALGGAGGSSTSRSGVSNSGNSTNNNQSTATSNGDNSNNSTEVTNIKPASAGAFAPVGFATAPCLATLGGGAQTISGGISFGSSHTDKGCDSRATAQQFALLLNNRVAAAKILCTTKAAKRAHLTLEDCLASVPNPEPVRPVVVAPAPAPLQPPEEKTVVTVYVPQPQPTVLEVKPVVAPPVQVKKPVIKKPVPHKPCVVPDSLRQPVK